MFGTMKTGSHLLLLLCSVCCFFLFPFSLLHCQIQVQMCNHSMYVPRLVISASSSFFPSFLSQQINFESGVFLKSTIKICMFLKKKKNLVLMSDEVPGARLWISTFNFWNFTVYRNYATSFERNLFQRRARKELKSTLLPKYGCQARLKTKITYFNNHPKINFRKNCRYYMTIHNF